MMIAKWLHIALFAGVRGVCVDLYEHALKFSVCKRARLISGSE